MSVLLCFPPFRLLFPGAVDKLPMWILGRLRVFYFSLMYIYIIFFYCNIGLNIAIFSRNCNGKLLTCSFKFRRLFNFLADDGYEARNVLIKDVFYFWFCSPVYTETRTLLHGVRLG